MDTDLRTPAGRTSGAVSAAVVWLVLALVSVCGPLMFLVGPLQDFPMDDAYIHFQYARNLATLGRLDFNPGEFRGLGTTSLLWPLALAGGIKSGISPELGARILGIVSLFGAALCVFHLALPMFASLWPTRARAGALLTAALLALSGNVIWFTLSGMETTLFLALGFLALVCYQRGNWAGVGLASGLAVTTRPEGLVLAPVFLLLEIVRLRRGGAWAWSGWALALLLAAIPAGGWFAFCHETTGHWLPTTFAGKRVCHAVAIEHFLDKLPALGLYTGAAQPLFVLLWLGYAMMYVFGVAAFPGPALMLKSDLGGAVALRLSVIGLALIVVVVLPLLWAGGRSAGRFLRRPRTDGAAARSDFVALGTAGVWLWALLHNLTYLALLPDTGTATRYQAINHLMLWWLVALGLVAVWERRRLLTAAALVVGALVVTDLGFWKGVYDANLEHMRNARIAAGQFLTSGLPPGSRVAAFDIGALRYFGDKPIIDLGGLTDTAFADYQGRGAVDQYLKDRGATHLALPSRHSTETVGLYDFGTYLGIDTSPLYTLRELRVFEIDYGRWLRGMQATGNYQPSVRVWEIEWRN
jgi:hypothetical protein